MRRQKVPVYSGGERETLSDSPFASLSKPADAASDQSEETAPPPPKQEQQPFRVPRTRKGGWPIRLERRAGGKSATVITTVEGDATALLRALKKICSAGGVVRDGAVEIQGDQSDRISAYLDSIGAGKG